LLRVTEMVRPQRVLAFLVYAVIGLAAWCGLHLGVSWVGQDTGLHHGHHSARTTMHAGYSIKSPFGIQPERKNSYGYRADTPMGGPHDKDGQYGKLYRPEGGPARKMAISRLMRHVPDGVDRPYGPGRPLFLNKSFINTLEAAVSDEGKGGLRGRWKEEMKRHLEEVRALAAAGETPEVAMFWDIENMRFGYGYEDWKIKLEPEYKDPTGVMKRTLTWCAGILEAPLTHVEAVEFTPFANTAQEKWNSGFIDQTWILRKIGGVVHRAWPKVSETADEILLDRMRDHMDMMHNGTIPKKMIFVFSGDMGFLPLLEAAQRQGITCCTIGKHEIGRYYPAGLDFSVTVQFPRRNSIEDLLYNQKFDIFRPDEEWLPEHGPRLYLPGTLRLEPKPHWEQDRRILHDFVKREELKVDPAKHDGTWRRSELLLNLTLAQALQRRLAGSQGFNHTLKRHYYLIDEFKNLSESDREAIHTDLAQLSQLSPEDNAAVFWNWDDMQVGNMGAPQREVFARFVKYFDGFLGVPVKWLQAAFFVEPWEQNFGGVAQDWRYTMQKAGGFIHRIWPPKAEAGKTALMKRVGALAREANLAREEGRSTANIPRMVCVLAEDLIFDEQLRMVQQAGISGLWIGPEGNGIFYPRGSAAKIEINIPLWCYLREDIAMAMRNPFLPGASTPDCPIPVYADEAVPADPHWGEPDQLQLADLELSEEPTTSRIGVGIL